MYFHWYFDSLILMGYTAGAGGREGITLLDY